jgi:hypothetical protein
LSARGRPAADHAEELYRATLDIAIAQWGLTIKRFGYYDGASRSDRLSPHGRSHLRPPLDQFEDLLIARQWESISPVVDKNLPEYARALVTVIFARGSPGDLLRFRPGVRSLVGGLLDNLPVILMTEAVAPWVKMLCTGALGLDGIEMSADQHAPIPTGVLRSRRWCLHRDGLFASFNPPETNYAAARLGSATVAPRKPGPAPTKRALVKRKMLEALRVGDDLASVKQASLKDLFGGSATLCREVRKEILSELARK